MSISLVQSNQANSPNSTSTTQAVTLGSGITQGNLVVAAVACGNNATTITGPSGWTQAIINQPAGASALIETSIWYMVVTGGHAGETSWTWTFASAHSLFVCIEEWSSTTGWMASPVDQTVQGDTAGSPTTSTTPASGTTSTTLEAVELWIGSIAYKGSAQSETSITSGWTKDVESTLAAANTMTMLYQVAAATGTAGVQYTIGSGQFWAGVAATFKPAIPRTIPATAALQSTGLVRTITSKAALSASGVSRTIPATAALSASGVARTIPATAALANNKSRTIPATVSLTNSGTRTIPATAALQSLSNPRNIPGLAALSSSGVSRVIPAMAALSQSAVFYASNVASTIGGLTQSDQMSQVSGGAETSVSVTMPATSLNTYVELLAQGGTSSATNALPAPTGKGWSLSLAGNTILSGFWSSAFTLAKSGSTISGASFYVRWYRRTMDGTYYPIGSDSLTSQSFSTTKSVYSLPGVQAALWQFISGDVLYIDAFVYNGATSWASAVFTVYVSNSATQGVYNDGIIIAPPLISTPPELSCLIGTSNFQSGSGIPVLNQSFTLADALDQRSILTLTGEDVAGTLSYTPAQPVMLSDHDQGLLYTGYLNSDNVSKPSAGGAAQLEHQMTFADHHRDADKRANTTNYLNWTSGDMVCDFIQQTLSQEGVTGAFALESDYTPTTFGQGTLSGTVATTTTSPFTYAPNTSSPPVTSNTGDLELTRAGTQFTLTESATADFSSGTLTNMAASNNQLNPSTQSAIKVTAVYSPVAGTVSATATESGATQTSQEIIANLTRASIWTGSMTCGTSDTFNYDVWIASTSPAYLVGVDMLFSDGVHMTDLVGTLDNSSDLGVFDSNGVSVDLLQDLSAYAKDTWYTRTITLPSGRNGKTITEIDVYLAGSASGNYTFYVKNCYLGSQSGSPYFSTSATSIEDASKATTIGAYLPGTINRTVVTVYNPLASNRVSPSHSISGVGLVQNSTITWTASLPVSGAVPATYPPGTSGTPASTSGASSMVMMVSYDGTCWLQCTNAQALPGLPPGANVSGLSLYLREQFAAGYDPTAIPALLSVQITINSAANQTVSDVTAIYGTSTQWNTGTQVLSNPNSAGNLTMGGSANPLTQGWSSSTILNSQTFLAGWTNTGTQAVTGGAYTMIPGNNAGTWCQTRLDFAGYLQNGTIEADIKTSSLNNTATGMIYRQTGWGNANFDHAYFCFLRSDGAIELGYGSNSFSNTAGTYTSLGAVAATVNVNTFYHLKIVLNGNRHTVYFNHSGSPIIDVLDNAYTAAGQIGFRCYSTAVGYTGSFDNLSVVTSTVATWLSPSISLNALGTCGYSQLCWTDLDSRGQVESTTTVLATIDGGTSWQQCTNGAEVPQLPRGTSVSGVSIQFQAILFSSTPPISTPVIMGLYARICGNYGTVTGTRVSPAISLSPVGYVASSNAMWNANTPTSTTLVVASSQDASVWTTIGGSGAGAALSYWTNQVAATQDSFATNTSANYTNTNKSGGSTATPAYDTANSRITLTGGTGGLYLNNSISCTDVDLLVDMDQSDAGGLVWRKVDASNYYELGVYDASSSGGFTNTLRLYKVASGIRSLLGSASSVTFTRTTIHRPRVTMQGGLINVYWDGACVQSYLDTSPLGSGACGMRNDGGTSRYYQLWIQPLGTNLSGQALYTKTTMTTTDPSQMPQLFTLVACVRGPSIATGATISQLHSITTPFATYYSREMDSCVQASGDYCWYIDRWRQLRFGPRLARPGAFPVQSIVDPANSSGYLLYRPQVSVLAAADLFRSQQIVTNVSGLVTPPPEIKVADGSTTSWTMGYPLYSAPTVLVGGQPATIGVQGIDNNRQLYWQPGSPSISYDGTLPKLPAGTILSFTYVGESTINVVLNNSGSQIIQAALEQNSGIVAEIETALNSTASGMTTAQATTFGNGLLSRYGNNSTIETIGTTLYQGLVPGTTVGVFIPEMMSTWNSQLPIVKITTTAFQSQNGIVYFYSIDATNGPNLSGWQRVWYQG
jgi:hypothetical protein